MNYPDGTVMVMRGLSVEQVAALNRFLVSGENRVVDEAGGKRILCVATATSEEGVEPVEVCVLLSSGNGLVEVVMTVVIAYEHPPYKEALKKMVDWVYSA